MGGRRRATVTVEAAVVRVVHHTPCRAITGAPTSDLAAQLDALSVLVHNDVNDAVTSSSTLPLKLGRQASEPVGI